MTAVLVAEALRKSYGGTTALDGVSLSVDAGEVFALVGPNGAGKTTLVRALTGTTTPDEGSVSVFGDSPAAVDKSRVGLLPQDFSPPDRLTARELVAYYAGLYDDARDPDEALAAVGLGATDTRYANLSGGQQRRACVATALVNDPDVLFLDEPTTGIDPAGRQTLWRVLRELTDGGTTIFLTTHDMTEAEELADRVGLLADGSLVEEGTPAALVSEYGGESRLVVATDAAPSVELPYPTEPSDRELVVHGVAPADIGDVVAALEEQGVAYDALSWKQPDLESVYLRLADDSPGVDGEPLLAGGGR